PLTPILFRTPICCCNPPPTTEIPTLSLHDALPIYPNSIAAQAIMEFLQQCPDPAPLSHPMGEGSRVRAGLSRRNRMKAEVRASLDRKSTRLNSSHGSISYAVFCLKKKTNKLANEQC